MVVFWHFRTHFCTLLSYCLLRTTIIHYLKCVSSGCWHPKHVIRALCWCGTGHYGIILCNIGNNTAFELRELQFRDAFCYLIQRFFIMMRRIRICVWESGLVRLICHFLFWICEILFGLLHVSHVQLDRHHTKFTT
jgi:hypothetical protein